MLPKGTQLLLLSSSTVHGTEYLQYAVQDIISFLRRNKVSRILFVPYALSTHDEYTDKIRKCLEPLGCEVDGIHVAADPVAAVLAAQAVYVGGGNTFRLLKSLYEHGLLEPIRSRVLRDGVPYIGSSAGTNVATASICTTNDMPIVFPPSFTALGLVPFNINPHYIDADPDSTHHGETREERIAQYHEIPGMPIVLGLREGCILHVDGLKAVLQGVSSARLFQPGKTPEELPIGSDVSYLMNQGRET